MALPPFCLFLSCFSLQPACHGAIRHVSHMRVLFADVVTTLRPCAEGTVHTVAMEFDLRGSFPARIVDAFLAQQAKIFSRLSRYIASDVGKVAMMETTARLIAERRHPTVRRLCDSSFCLPYAS
jgi:hypothetical protein